MADPLALDVARRVLVLLTQPDDAAQRPRRLGRSRAGHAGPAAATRGGPAGPAATESARAAPRARPAPPRAERAATERGAPFVHQFRRELAPEPGGRTRGEVATATSRAGPRHQQGVARARDPHVAEPPLLLESLGGLHRAGQREEAILHPGEDHDGPFETLRGV